MEKGKIYFYDKIEEYAEENDFDISEYGEEIVGEYFISMKKGIGYGIVISFIMTGLAQYECIYSDIII